MQECRLEYQRPKNINTKAENQKTVVKAKTRCQRSKGQKDQVWNKKSRSLR